MTKTFTIAGTAIKDGRRTWRFASGKLKAREAVLVRTGFTDIQLIELPGAMSREQAIEHLATLNITAEMPKTGRKPGTAAATPAEEGARELLDAIADAAPASEPVAEPVAVTAEDMSYLTDMKEG
jgi:hypothetical protein